MAGRRRTGVGLLMLTALAVIGMLWYWLLEEYSLVDAAYQTTTTITTVGEVRPCDDSAKMFSI